MAKGAGSSYATILRGLLAERGVAGLYQGFSAGFANNALTQALGFATYEVWHFSLKLSCQVVGFVQT